MKAFKITMNGRDLNERFATSAEAQMLVDVYAEDHPDAEIKIVEIEQNTNRNHAGGLYVDEIEQ